jgi:hypothetical protein
MWVLGRNAVRPTLTFQPSAFQENCWYRCWYWRLSIQRGHNVINRLAQQSNAAPWAANCKDGPCGEGPHDRPFKMSLPASRCRDRLLSGWRRATVNRVMVLQWFKFIVTLNSRSNWSSGSSPLAERSFEGPSVGGSSPSLGS